MPTIYRMLPPHAQQDHWAILTGKSGKLNARVKVLNGVVDQEAVKVSHSFLGPPFTVDHTFVNSSLNTFQNFPVTIWSDPQDGSLAEQFYLDGAQDAPKPIPGSTTSEGKKKKKRVRKSIKFQHTDSGTPIVTLENAKRLIAAQSVQRSAMIWGPPGIGKSDAVRQMHEDVRREHPKAVLIDVRLTLLDPVDLRGIGVPDLEAGVCRWLPAEFMPTEPNTILFLDEVTTAPQALQACAYQLALDRKCGDHRIPEDCRIIFAGNRVQDKSVAYKMPAALANRMSHYQVEVDANEWERWAIRKSIHYHIVTFIKQYPDMLWDMDEDNASEAWPSPRTWAMANEMYEHPDLDLAEKKMAMSAFVGGPRIVEFDKHIKAMARLPNPDLILGMSTPPNVELSVGEQQKMTTALASACQDQDEHLQRALRFGKRHFVRDNLMLLVRRLEEKFGEDRMEEIPLYQSAL